MRGLENAVKIMALPMPQFLGQFAPVFAFSFHTPAVRFRSHAPILLVLDDECHALEQSSSLRGRSQVCSVHCCKQAHPSSMCTELDSPTLLPVTQRGVRDGHTCTSTTSCIRSALKSSCSRSAGRSAAQDSSCNAAALLPIPIARVIGGHKGSATWFQKRLDSNSQRSCQAEFNISCQ